MPGQGATERRPGLDTPRGRREHSRAVNVILLEPSDFVTETRVRLSGRRLAHVREVCRSAAGDELRVGLIGGKLGTARVLEVDESRLELDVALDRAPPAALPFTLVVALPRPPTLRKLLQQATAMGVKRFVLLHTRRVEKSYWQSRGLAPEALRHQLCLGLEQAGDTVLPEVETERRFRPFAEDRLPDLARQGTALLADPDSSAPCPREPGPATLIVGPEGGFVPFEVERLVAAGARPVGLGVRRLRVETAVVALLARLTG